METKYCYSKYPVFDQDPSGSARFPPEGTNEGLDGLDGDTHLMRELHSGSVNMHRNKSYWVVCCLSAFFFLPLSIYCQKAEDNPTYAVLKLFTEGIAIEDAELYEDLVSEHIGDEKKYEAVDRTQTEAALKDTDYSQTDCFDEKCQIEIGEQIPKMD